MNKVRFGIIGIGNMGSSHSRSFLEGKIENGILTAICDIKPERMKKITELPNAENIKCFNTYQELIESKIVDAIIVSTPHYFHPPIAIYAMEHGVAVISEKPAGVYTNQVIEMNKTAEKTGVLFGVMFNQRTNCLYRKMREIITSGGIGKIKRISWIITDWYRTESYYKSGDWRATWKGEGGGVLFNQCPHQLDLIQWVTDMKPTKVHAFCHYGKWHNIEVEDDVTAYLEYENGATGTFITSTGDAPGTNRFEVLGDEGRLICENGSKIIYQKLKQNEREFCNTCPEGFRAPDYEEIPVETDGKNPQHIGILNNFANAFLGLEPLFVDGKEGIYGVELMDAMQLSGWLGETVTLPIDGDLYEKELQKRISNSKIKKEVHEQVFNTEGTYESKK